MSSRKRDAIEFYGTNHHDFVLFQEVVMRGSQNDSKDFQREEVDLSYVLSSQYD